MKIFKSIKWRLQLWYGLILVVVLAGFGFTAYQLEHGRMFGRIDNELQRRINLLAEATHPAPPPRPWPSNGPQMDRQPQWNDAPPERGGAEFMFPYGYQPQVGDWQLRERLNNLFHAASETNRFHITIWFGDFVTILERAESLANTTNDAIKYRFWIYPRGWMEHGPMIATADEFRMAGWWGDTAYFTTPNNQPRPEAKQRPETVGEFRGMVEKLPSGETLQVTCNIAPELKELRRTALKLAGVGGVILFFGLAGGWWIVSRSMRPVIAISSTAAKISAGDLSQRINVAEAESELGQLAGVLNSTFARLEAAFAQQQQFTSDAAHELRTPVSVMLTQAQTALNRERTAPEYREVVETCQRAAQRMRRLIESLLALARLDAGQEVLKRLQFDFSKTISDCTELVKPMAEERGVKIISELPALEITGDSERLAQVVTNLLTNAIQYNRRDGEVRVKLEPQDGLAVLTVSDTGAGISAEDLPRVFERFYRADKSRSTGGNGLGLAISKAVVEAHGGTIEVASEEDVGTTFTVRLPILR